MKEFYEIKIDNLSNLNTLCLKLNMFLILSENINVIFYYKIIKYGHLGMK